MSFSQTIHLEYQLFVYPDKFVLFKITSFTYFSLYFRVSNLSLMDHNAFTWNINYLFILTSLFYSKLPLLHILAYILVSNLSVADHNVFTM